MQIRSWSQWLLFPQLSLSSPGAKFGWSGPTGGRAVRVNVRTHARTHPLMLLTISPWRAYRPRRGIIKTLFFPVPQLHIGHYLIRLLRHHSLSYIYILLFQIFGDIKKKEKRKAINFFLEKLGNRFFYIFSTPLQFFIAESALFFGESALF